MSVKIRLARRGRKKLALYDIVVADARSPRDGRFIERIGRYNPNTNPAAIDLDQDRAVYWLLVGAQPTDTANAILRYKGALIKKHLQVGVNKGAITQEVADERFAEWVAAKEAKVAGKVGDLSSAKEAAKADRLEAEAKVRAARQEVIDARDAAKRAEQAAADQAKADSEVNSAAAIAAAHSAAEVVAEAPAAEVVAEAPAAEGVAEAPTAEVAPKSEAAPEA
jgi:small subunit ribosomal protein S16